MSLRLSILSLPFALALFASNAATGQEAPLLAGERMQLSRLFTNDYLGDGHDRWRTASYSLSALRPSSDGSVSELRLRWEIVSGADTDLRPGEMPDRNMAGMIGIGLFRSDRLGAADYRIGADVTAMGPQTGVVNFQQAVHRVLGMRPPSDHMESLQLEDEIFLGASGEVGRDFSYAASSARAWISASSGTETFIRAGIDYSWGAASAGFGVRDEVTGWRLPVTKGFSGTGTTLYAGADIAKIYDTRLLRSDEFEDIRIRARIGAKMETQSMGLFYGVTWLSEEFRLQQEPQFLGSLAVSARF